MTLLAETLLDSFKDAMLSKLQLRAAKHPNDNFLTMSIDDMKKYPIEQIMYHMDQEIEELYTARGFGSSSDAMKENVDNANMNFIEWALRHVRETKNVK